jgi:alpha-1,2-mannosyltransferase
LGQKLIDAGSVILGLGLFFLAIGLALVERRRTGLPWLPLTIKEKEVPPTAKTESAAADTATD